MNNSELAAYLSAAAWADGPVTDSEQNLVENLLFSLGLERDEAKGLLKQWEFKAPESPDLSALSDRGQGIGLLRALLILSYSDGHFGIEELPYLSKILDRFKVSSEELMQLRLQARYYLDPETHNVEIDPVLVEGGRWTEVESSAQAVKTRLREEARRRIADELMMADETTLLLSLYRGRDFDPDYARAEFEKRREDLIERHGPKYDSQLLQAQILVMTMAKWDRLYADRCAGCGLNAPGRKGDLCPRCGEEYR